MPFVLDASVALAWLLADEANDYSERVLDRLNREEVIAPAIWPMEVANVLVLAERRGRLSPEQVSEALEEALSLPITVYGTAPDQVLNPISGLARRHGLSVYDATYLELAIREELPLATLDNSLREAAQRAGVPLIE